MLSMSTSVRGKRQCGTSLTITSCLAMALRAMAPNWLKPPSKTAGELDYDCNDYILKPRVKITNNINEKKYILFKRERGAPRGLASLFVPWLLAAFFGQPTPIAQMHALLMDALRLAWVCQKGCQNRLAMMRQLCYSESGSSMFCGCGSDVSIVQYTIPTV